MLKRILYVSAAILWLVLAHHVVAASAQSNAATNSLSETAAHDVPDSTTLLRLRKSIGPRSRVKAIGTFGTLELRSVDLAGDGLSGRAAHPMSADHAGYEGRIPWTEVSELRVRRSGVESGLSTGMAAGAGTVLTAVIVYAIHGGSFDSKNMLTIGQVTVVWVAAGALVGAVIGTPFRQWKMVYRRTKAFSVGLPLRIVLSDHRVIEVTRVEPWSPEMLRIVSLDGGVSYLAANHVREIRDARGTDWTAEVLQKRRRLPR